MYGTYMYNLKNKSKHLITFSQNIQFFLYDQLLVVDTTVCNILDHIGEYFDLNTYITLNLIQYKNVTKLQTFYQFPTTYLKRRFILSKEQYT